MSETIELIINGEPRRVNDVHSAADLLATLALDPRAVVVELNRAIVRRQNLATATIASGDVVEIVHFVGGG